MTIPLVRRLLIGLVTTVTAAVFFRAQVADALVTRGDDFFRAGRPGDAMRYYGRALALDGNAVAADRLALMYLERHAPGDGERALAAADRGLRSAPDTVNLLVDRALAASRLRRWGDARRDFERAARLEPDWRYEHFAGRMAQRAGDHAGAVAHLRAAAARGPHDGPSRAALASLDR